MKNKKILISIISVLVIAAVGFGAYSLLSGDEDYRTIKITEYSGTVKLMRDSIGKVDLYDNIRLQDKDEVQTGNDSYAYFALDDDKYVYAEENTDVKIEATGSGNNSKTKLVLKSGSITSEIQKSLSKNSNYEIETPNSTMSVRGTVFRVEVKYDANGDSYTKLQVYDGKVGSTLIYPDGSKSKEILVPVNYGVDVHGDTKVSEYILKKNSQGKKDEIHPLVLKELPSSALKVLDIVYEHDQVPDLIETHEEVKELYQTKLEEEKLEPVASYDVTVYGSDYSSGTTASYTSGQLVSPSNPSKEGYTFNGWYRDSALNNQVEIPLAVTGNISLYPAFTPNTDTKYKVETYEQEVGSKNYSLKSVEDKTGTTDTTVTVPTAKVTGMTCNVSKSDKAVIVSPNGKAVAKIYYDRNSISYEVNGKTYSGLYGQSIKLDKPEKTGYIFMEYNTKPDGSGDKYNGSFKLSSSIKLYPVYKAMNNIDYVVETYYEDIKSTKYTLSSSVRYKGTADSTVSISTPDVKGMTLNSDKSNLKIKVEPDGTTVAKVYYDRNKIKYYVDDVEYSAMYGESVNLTEGTKVGYEFKEFNTEKDGSGEKVLSPYKVEDEAEIYSVFTPRDNIKYTVVTHRPKLDETAGEIIESEDKTGTADTKVAVSAPLYKGFSVKEDAPTEATISADGTTVVNLYYNRDNIKYTVDGNEYFAPYETVVTPNKGSKTGYNFKEFNTKKDGSGTKIENSFELTDEVTFYSIYTPRDDVKYTVKISLQGLDDTTLYPIDESKTKTYTGTADTKVTLEIPNIKGFTIQDNHPSEVDIAADGSAVVELRYDRNKVSYTVNGVKTSDYFGKTITPAQGSKTGYTFKEFNTKEDGSGTSYSSSFQLEDEITVYSIFSPNTNIKYTVVSYIQNLDGKYIAQTPIEYTGEADKEVDVPTPQAKTGFHLNTKDSAATITIKPDGTSLANVYFDRDIVKYSVNGCAPIEYLYGSQVPLEQPSKTGYDFKEFNTKSDGTGDKITPVGNMITLTSDLNVYYIFTPNTHTQVKVIHKIQNTALDGYEEYITFYVYGTSDTSMTLEEVMSKFSSENNQINGFTLNTEMTPTSVYVKADGTATIDMYYDRNLISYTLDGVKKQAPYKTNLNLVPPTKQGYKFKEFNTSANGNGTVISANHVITGPVNIYSVFTPCTDTVYKVETYEQTLGGDQDYSLKKSENKAGTTGESVTFTPSSMTGFHVNTEESKLSITIAADGSSIVKVYYDRDIINYTVDNVKKSAQYGTLITLTPAPKELYTFKEYNTKSDGSGDKYENTFTLTKAVELFPIYTQVEAKYTVHKTIQHKDSADTTEDVTLKTPITKLSGVTFEDEVPGYEKVYETFDVSADGSTVVNVDYKIIKISVYNWIGDTEGWDKHEYYAIDLLNGSTNVKYANGNLLFTVLENEKIKYTSYFRNTIGGEALDGDYLFTKSESVYSSATNSLNTVSINCYLDNSLQNSIADSAWSTISGLSTGKIYNLDQLKDRNEALKTYIADKYAEGYTLDESKSTGNLYLTDQLGVKYNVYLMNSTYKVTVYLESNYGKPTVYCYKEGDIIKVSDFDKDTSPNCSIGWYTDSKCTSPASDTYTVTCDMTFYEQKICRFE